ncbi:hypothetical protein F66182_11879 [Fusarium sp. NRRL 66182]|nr:hypothetical protein F66182_11879 [Fusarium sp. NRRL 66182]
MDNSDDNTLSSTEKEVRRRLWWSIYSLERTTTLKLNRPRSISAEIISAPIPSPCPTFDKAQVFDNHLHQIFYAKLALIIDRVAESSSLSMWPPVQSSGTDTPRQWFETVEAELKSWKRSLPSDFALELIDPRDSRYRAVFHLHLQYYYAWIAVGKVDFGLESLRKMADGNKSAKTGVRFVEMLRSIADEAVAKLRQTTYHSQAQQGTYEDNETRYVQWAEWLARADGSQQPTTHSAHMMSDTNGRRPYPILRYPLLFWGRIRQQCQEQDYENSQMP